MEQKLLERQLGAIPASGLGPDGKLKLEIASGVWSPRAVDSRKSLRSRTAPTIPLTRNGCGRSTNTDRTDPFSRGVTESCGIMFSWMRDRSGTHAGDGGRALETSAASGWMVCWRGKLTSLFPKLPTTRSAAN